MGKECANCGNERIMLCPFCEHNFSEQSKKNDAELRQLRREVERLRAVAEAVKRFADRPLIATLRDDLKARLAELEKQ